jgi:D-amino peptidase
MKRFLIAAASVALALSAVTLPIGAQQPALKVFISVDMEGLAGVVAGSDVSPTGRDYAHFRTIMAAETNAAIEGAYAAGAREFVVRDSHGDKTNLLPGDVNRTGVVLIRGASTGPKNMMEGIDASFGAAIFIGYHAKAGTPNAILEHTSNGNVIDFSINGVSLPEGGYNALVAGLYKVPVVFAAGDRALTEQLKGLLGPIETVAVKEEIGGDASRGLSPRDAQDQIRAGVERGVRKRAELKPFVMAGPYTMVLKVRAEKPPPPYKGAEKTGPGEFKFTSPDLLEVLNAFNAMK